MTTEMQKAIEEIQAVEENSRQEARIQKLFALRQQHSYAAVIMNALDVADPHWHDDKSQHPLEAAIRWILAHKAS